MSSAEDQDPPTLSGLSEEELQAVEDRLFRKIMAKVAPGGPPGESSGSEVLPVKEGERGETASDDR